METLTCVRSDRMNDSDESIKVTRPKILFKILTKGGVIRETVPRYRMSSGVECLYSFPISNFEDELSGFFNFYFTNQ